LPATRIARAGCSKPFTAMPHIPFKCTLGAAAWPVLSLVTLPAWADLAPPPKDGLWRGIAGAALSATSGNTKTTSVLINTDAARASDHDKIALGAALNYARGTDEDGVRTTTADKASAFGQYDRDFAPRWFGFGRLAIDRDALIDLSSRSTLTGGVGYRLIETDAHTFTLLGGLGYTTERYSTPQTIANETDTRFSRPNAFLAEESAHKLSETTSLKQRLEAAPALDGSGAVLWKFNANLDVAINKSLSLTVGVIDTYNTEPPEGASKNDVVLFTGINVKFGAPVP
jgi:putative salt-induced outer membrane protein